MGLFLFFALFSALVHIVLVLAPGTTEQIALSACGKGLLTKLVKQIKEKPNQRSLLLDERKAVPMWNIAKRQELAKQIATLSEDIEELRSEKAMLLRSLDCADDAAMGDVKKDIAAMEAALKKPDEQERKYAAELESALQQYRKLKAQAAEFDAEELADARLDLRPSMDRSKPLTIRSAVPLPWQKPGRIFPRYWRNIRKNPALSGNGFASRRQ